jgi:hypothetical protein
MDGTIDLRQQQWKSAAGIAAPLNTNELRYLLCPLCVRLGRFEALSPLADAAAFGCARGHRFESVS